ncbi:MAG: phytoene/squalene synthase family protein, partial [Spirochaetales bacterium]|nr:phytoene/squalene synthase family protein [Spirochaetales bacterium]
SIFFPKSVRDDVFILYAFVRTADNYVDEVPQDPAGFSTFRRMYLESLDGRKSGNLVIDSFVDLMKRKDFSPQWVEAFLHSMEMDLSVKTYPTLEDTLEYIHGSAEVIGLFMANIMGLPRESHHAAMMLGRAMQYINFIRDIDEDNSLGRTYLPISRTALQSLRREQMDRDEFIRYIRENIELYRQWQRQAETGYSYIPHRYLVPIKTAADMYGWTAGIIYENPLVVFERKVKPSRTRIVVKILVNALRRA